MFIPTKSLLGREVPVDETSDGGNIRPPVTAAMVVFLFLFLFCLLALTAIWYKKWRPLQRGVTANSRTATPTTPTTSPSFSSKFETNRLERCTSTNSGSTLVGSGDEKDGFGQKFLVDDTLSKLPAAHIKSTVTRGVMGLQKTAILGVEPRHAE